MIESGRLTSVRRGSDRTRAPVLCLPTRSSLLLINISGGITSAATQGRWRRRRSGGGGAGEGSRGRWERKEGEEGREGKERVESEKGWRGQEEEEEGGHEAPSHLELQRCLRPKMDH